MGSRSWGQSKIKLSFYQNKVLLWGELNPRHIQKTTKLNGNRVKLNHQLHLFATICNQFITLSQKWNCDLLLLEYIWPHHSGMHDPENIDGVAFLAIR